MDVNSYDDELDVREQLIFDIMDLVAKEGFSLPFLHNPFILNLSPSLKVFVWAKKDAALLFTETPHRTPRL